MLAAAITAMPTMSYNNLDGGNGAQDHPNFTRMLNGAPDKTQAGGKGGKGIMMPTATQTMNFKKGDLGEDSMPESIGSTGPLAMKQIRATGEFIENAYERIKRARGVKEANQFAKWADHYHDKRKEAMLFHDPMFRQQAEHYLERIDPEGGDKDIEEGFAAKMG